jgi:BlaI family penicillinase repressor
MAKSSKSKNATTRPTEAELAILQALWELGPSTVRQLQDLLKQDRGTGYTTTLKLLQIMLDKGLVKRDDSLHAHVYRAAVTRSKTQRKIIKQVMDQVFAGSAQQLVLQALSSQKSTPEELSEIRRLLDQLEKGQE